MFKVFLLRKKSVVRSLKVFQKLLQPKVTEVAFCRFSTKSVFLKKISSLIFIKVADYEFYQISESTSFKKQFWATASIVIT